MAVDIYLSVWTNNLVESLLSTVLSFKFSLRPLVGVILPVCVKKQNDLMSVSTYGRVWR